MTYSPGGGVGLHAATHTNGTDDIQDATAAQKGLATAAQITKLDGLVTNATHTGDVTGSGALTIANDAVTYAKMQNTSGPSRLLGRGSAAGAGDIEELTVGTGLSLSGTVLSAPPTGVVIVKSQAPNTAVNMASVTPVSLLSESVTGIAAGDIIEVEVVGSLLNNSGGTITPTYQLILGAIVTTITLGTTVATNATRRAPVVLLARFAIHSASDTSIVGSLDSMAPAASNTPGSIATTTQRRVWNTTATDLTGTQSAQVNVNSSTATATQTFYLHSYTVRKLAAV